MKQKRFKLRQKEHKDNTEQHVYIELDTKCSCLQSKSTNNASIQFSRRYLQCQSSMPISVLRLYIQQILPHSSMTQVSLYDSNDRLLNDSDRLSSLNKITTTTKSTSHFHIPIRFTLLNTITSLGHCLCSSSIEEQSSVLSSSPTIIKCENIDETLSTCSLIESKSKSKIVYSPCLSSPNESTNSISIVNLLTPPLSQSSVLVENIVDKKHIDDKTIIDQITSQFGEICPPLTKKKSNRSSKKYLSTHSSNVPLDLSLKKRPSSFDLYSSQTKWIKI